MKFTISWLKEHLDTNASVEEICKTLTEIGLEVESVCDRSLDLKDFEVAYIKEANQHPNADRLKVCKVETKTGEIQVVCGAPNARAGIKVVLARPGMKVPSSGIVLKLSKIRDVESQGMLCSADELNIGSDSDGILELSDKTNIGDSFIDAYGLNDVTIEIAITPNRGDCLGVRGIARDLSAAGLGTLRPLNYSKVAKTFDSKVKVTIQDDNCPIFLGRHFKGVKNQESPAWLKNRLTAIGLRPISALVDITNYITFDLARPLHVYDVAKLDGDIVVRGSVEGEKINALNGKEYVLPVATTVIADSAKVLGIGGIIGSENSGCDENTSEVFLEVALFNPSKIAREGRDLQINSDARYRFERNVDNAFVYEAVEIASRMIIDICGGEASEVVVSGSNEDKPREIKFNLGNIERLTSIAIQELHAIDILTKLGFICTKTDAKSYNLIIPSWRKDIEGEADVVEEIARIYGYDKIPSIPVVKSITSGRQNASTTYNKSSIARNTLAGRGMIECCTFSFVKESKAALFSEIKNSLKIANPISSELNYMRPSLLINLLDAVAKNSNFGNYNLSLFEVASVFNDVTPEAQKRSAGGIRTGDDSEKGFHKSRSFDVFDVKADAIAVLESLGLNADKIDSVRNAPHYYHPSKSAALMLGSKMLLGYFGEIHPKILKEMDIAKPVFAFEIFLSAVPDSKAKSSAKPALEISQFPIVHRDFAFVVDEALESASVIKSVMASDKEHIISANIFDIFKAKDSNDSSKSIAVSVQLKPKDKTFTDEEITAISNKVINKVVTDHNAKLRG